MFACGSSCITDSCGENQTYLICNLAFCWCSTHTASSVMCPDVLLIQTVSASLHKTLCPRLTFDSLQQARRRRHHLVFTSCIRVHLQRFAHFTKITSGFKKKKGDQGNMITNIMLARRCYLSLTRQHLLISMSWQEKCIFRG